MRFLSVCSGIEAASVAWNPLGWKAAAFAEIEPFPCSVLAHHYPDTPNLGDMTKFQEWPDVAVDLLCGGTPCQSFSVAGLRAGLADPRGNLALTYLAIAAKYRPRWLVWENVPGVFSSLSHDAPDPSAPPPPVDVERDGQELVTHDEYGAEELHAFNCFLAGLSELGYGWAYRVLDAQYFGVPQRRRRPFVVGCLGDWRCAAAVLFERHSLSGHPAPRREKGKAAPTIPSRSTAGGGLGTDFDCDGGLIAPDVARCIATREGSSQDWETTTMVAHAPDVAATMVARSSRGGGQTNSPGHNADEELVVVQPLAFQTRGSNLDIGEVSGTMGVNAGSASGCAPMVAFAATDYESGAFEQAEQAGPLTTSADRSRAAPILAFSAKDHGADAAEELAPTLRAGGHSASHANAGVMPAIAYTTKLHNTQSNNAGKVFAERTTALDANSPPPALLTAMQVRRLTPRECERLQGFPDDYTLIPHRGKPAADGPRYKALGNSWAVPCARWIGERIAAVDALSEQRELKAAA